MAPGKEFHFKIANLKFLLNYGVDRKWYYIWVRENREE